MDGDTGGISSISGFGEGADEVEARRNLKGFLALIGKFAVIGRLLTWICSGGSDNSGGRFFSGGRSPRSDSGDEHNVESAEEKEAVVQVMASVEGGWGCIISRSVRTSRENDTCRSTFSRESNGRVIIGIGRGGRRGVRSGAVVGGRWGVLSCPTKGSHRTHCAKVVARMLYEPMLVTHHRYQTNVRHTRK